MNLPVLLVCRAVVPLQGVPRVSRHRARSLFGYGGWVAVSGMAGPVLETLDRLVIGVVLGAKAVAHYTIAYQLATKLRVIPGSLSRALCPSFSASGAESSRDLARNSISALTAIMTPIVILAIFLVEPFLDIWVGADIARDAAPVAQVILVGVWGNSLAYLPLSLLQGVGRPGLVAKIHLLQLAPFVVVVYFAARGWGTVGAAVAWALRVYIDALLLFWSARIAGAETARVLMMPFALIAASLLTVMIWPQGWLGFSLSAVLFFVAAAMAVRGAFISEGRRMPRMHRPRASV